jgi:glutamine synthetase
MLLFLLPGLMSAIADVKKKVKESNINWIQLHFTDIIGRLRVLHLPVSSFFESVVENGVGFDGSSVGFAKVEKSDMIVKPDLDSFLVLPHEQGEARFIGEVFDSSGKPFIADPRNILKKAIIFAKNQGFDKVMFSPELEFYLLKEHGEEEPKIVEQQGYFAPPSLDDCKAFRKTMSEHLLSCGYPVKYHHHETGLYQHEIEIKELDALDAADYCIFFKYLAREVAKLFELLVTFMPKPFSNDAGSGTHAHICFYKAGKNMFQDDSDAYRLSQTARYFIGGILEHSRGMAAIANPTLNSYKRLIPNFEAPVYIAWAQYNRSSLVRIPARKNVDVEVRNPDAAANPYLLYSAMIHAGLDGIKRKIEYEPISENIYKMSENVSDLKIKKLPTNLNEALIELEADDVIKKAIGKETVDMFIKYKQKEWQQYIGETTDLEYRLYFHC